MKGIKYWMRERKPGPEWKDHFGRNYKQFKARDFDLISSMTAKEEALLLAEPKGLEFSYDDGFAVIATHGDEKVVGFTRLQTLLAKDHKDGEWMELGSTWVHEDYRGNSINKEMYSLLLPQHAQRNIVASTTSPASLAVGEQLGFVLIPRMSLPFDVWKSSCCCPASKTGTEENVGCLLAHAEPQHRGLKSCYFRVTAETARRMNLQVAA